MFYTFMLHNGKCFSLYLVCIVFERNCKSCCVCCNDTACHISAGNLLAPMDTNKVVLLLDAILSLLLGRPWLLLLAAVLLLLLSSLAAVLLLLLSLLAAVLLLLLSSLAAVLLLLLSSLAAVLLLLLSSLAAVLLLLLSSLAAMLLLLLSSLEHSSVHHWAKCMFDFRRTVPRRLPVGSHKPCE